MKKVTFFILLDEKMYYFSVLGFCGFQPRCPLPTHSRPTGLGDAANENVRSCVLGHHDPDIFELTRRSPTPMALSINVFPQTAACLQLKVRIVDIAVPS